MKLSPFWHIPRWTRTVSRPSVGVALFGAVLLGEHSPRQAHSRQAHPQIRPPSHATLGGDTVPRLKKDGQVSHDTIPDPLLNYVDTFAVATRWDSTRWKGRVIVGEYTTGTFCAFCQLETWMYDGFRRRYPATAFIPLSYHGAWNMPIANITDSLWEKVGNWYMQESTLDKNGYSVYLGRWKNFSGTYHRGTPCITGHAEGSGMTVPEMYDDAIPCIDSALTLAPEAALRIRVTPKGGTLVTQVTVDSLSPAHRDVYMRIVVIEDSVHIVPVYPLGSKKPRIRKDWYNVVRSVAHTKQYPLGIPLHAPQGRGTVRYTFDVARVQQQILVNYRLGVQALSTDPRSYNWDDGAQAEVGWFHDLFPDRKSWLIDPTRLHVVAFVQDMKTGEILQAQMVPVPAGPHGERLTL